MLLTRICAFFTCICTFFNVLFAGYIRYYAHNRIFLNQYYTQARSQRQTYDLVIPRSASGSTGLILCIHGGGWVEGSKDEYTGSLMQMSAQRGIAAACMNYRYVSETVGFDDVLDDISSALAAIKKTGAAFGVDFDREVNDRTFGRSGVTKLSTDKSRVLIYMIPTNEELMIAQDAERIAKSVG